MQSKAKMSAEICPTVTTDDPNVYKQQIEQTVAYAHRIHIDLSDGVFTRNKLMEIEDVWWPGGVRADLHVMYQRPFEHLHALIALRPQLIIVHAEAEGDFMEFAAAAHSHGVEVGVAILPETPVSAIEPALGVIDHVLIFSGNLGHFGGHADLGLLGKAQRLRDLKPQLELGWDGGVSDKNARLLALGGIDVLNAGGYLHGATDSKGAYATLKALVEN
jgi:ribulose-phosphate 3-epimerase